MQFLTISDSICMPSLGLGTWKSRRGEAAAAVKHAIGVGYRHIDCAPIYKNEKEIGPSLATAIQQNCVSRSDLWVTSKLWNNAHNPKHVRPALERSLKDLQLDYLDLFLIHWPVSFRQDIEFPRKPEEFLAPGEIPLIETWGAMEKMVKKGLCRAIGVCNFSLSRLQDLYSTATIPPAVNQIELHPYLQQLEMLEYCYKNNILLTAYSPLGSPDRPSALKKENEPSLLNHPLILQLSNKSGATPAQVLLCWALARQTAVIPKSVHPERILENFLSHELLIDQADLRSLDQLNLNYRYLDGAFFCGPGSPYTLSKLWSD
ncbi:MAG: aldo/keto reductase [Desulfobulbaceae bacterium]|nr:aldo/keto reductase [Desulfobulbaceae bacterium]